MSEIHIRRSVVWSITLVPLLSALPASDVARAVIPPGIRTQARPADVKAPSDDWIGRVTEEIRRSEYRFSRQQDGAWSAPNRNHDLRTRLDETGVRVISRTKGTDRHEGGWELRMALTAYGREGSLSPLPTAHPEAERERAEFRKGRLTEWYLNDENGLEQGFTLHEPPLACEPEGLVVLEMTLDGGLFADASDDGRAVLFKTAGGEQVLRYDGLKVDDARGTRLEARLVALPDRLQIRVDDNGAAYPLTVDPLIGSPNWTAESNQGNAAGGAQFGFSVASAGDVNNDGYSDVIVGAPLYDAGLDNEGRVFVWYGGPSLGPNGTPLNAGWSAESNQGGAQFGFSVASAGDVNGDGVSDVIIGAPYYDTAGLPVDAGRVFVWHGGPLGSPGVPGNADWTAVPPNTSSQAALFGYSVASAGDVNGDGVSDVIIGAPNEDYFCLQEGFARVYLGHPGSGLDPNQAWYAEGWDGITGTGCNWQFGSSVATAGDVNEDGFSDIIVGAVGMDNPEFNEGGAFVYFGYSFGVEFSPRWRAEGNQASGYFGISVATAGDVNHDGYSDIIIGGPQMYNNNQTYEGRAFVWYGGPSLGPNGTPLNADWSAESNRLAAKLGISVATAGDFNGDEISDIIVGASGLDNPVTDEGGAFVWLGSGSGLGPNGTLDNAYWAAESNRNSAFFGNSVATAGDVNGDGPSDLIIGAYKFTNPETNEGRVFVYHGVADADRDMDPDSSDCAPLNPAIHHGATEVCNGLDDDCDGVVDEGCGGGGSCPSTCTQNSDCDPCPCPEGAWCTGEFGSAQCMCI